MARQTVIRHFLLGMTIHAPVHRHLHPWFRRGFLALRDIPVTGLALHLSQDDMSPMGKEDMIGLLVDPFPMDLLTLFMNLSDFLLFGVLGDRIFVALQTDGHFGNAGERLVFKMGMAGNTFDPLLLVFLVIEGERLFGL